MTFDQAIGWNAWLSDNAGLRLEFRNSIDLPSEGLGRTHRWDQQYWAGLNWAWGGKAIDTDGDGVSDKKDKCPGTPAGATVDATGCPTDADGDGVWDGIDQCPNTPKGATVNAKGCPTDTDGDGVWDGIDQCPDTPKGAVVDAKGCPTDSDGDGVWDGIDQCPNTPKGATVDATGCPVDSDGDGVWDGIDRCPGTPAGAKVDASGCPIEVTEKETELLDTGMIRLQGVNFETAKADLLPESFPILDQVGPILVKWPQLQIEIGGHCDSRGSDAYNLTLSDARAASVRTYLTTKFTGIDAGQLTSKGYGESKPVAPNTNALNMAKNRRVEFVVLNKDVLKKEVERRKMLQK
jgi:outer membrane protein OmpA-like peptidoglycan-associated protein